MMDKNIIRLTIKCLKEFHALKSQFKDPELKKEIVEIENLIRYYQKKL